MTDEERYTVIEECAQRLLEVADGFERLARASTTADRGAARTLSDAYVMAADEVRQLNPLNVAIKVRNRERVAAWIAGSTASLPVLEPLCGAP